MQNVKIVFAGLDSAGKTSFLNTLEEKYSTLMNIKPTLGPDRREFRLFGFTISNWDLGGQETYRDMYFKEKNRYFSNINTLFYIFDVQDWMREDEAFRYLEMILETLDEFKETPNFILCWHKFDTDLETLPEYKERIEKLEQRLGTITNGRLHPRTFKTTIFEKWSLMKAFSQGVVELSPKKTFIDQQLRDFARLTFSSAVLLLDNNHLIMGSSTQKQELLAVCEAIVPHTSSTAERLLKYDIHADNIVITLKPGEYYEDVIQGKEMVALYVPLKIHAMSFSLVSLTKNPRTLKLMLTHSEKLSENLVDILKSFYF